jgi:hypothetical protein
MALDSGKHTETDINEVRCKVLEKGVSKERIDFLKDLLEYNGFTVQIAEEKRKTEEDPQTYIIGVTDITFNPVLAVYKFLLKTKDGRSVSPAYYNQISDDTRPEYYELKV